MLLKIIKKRNYIYNTIFIHWKKKSLIIGLTQFKPMLFKGQLYIHNMTSVTTFILLLSSSPLVQAIICCLLDYNRSLLSGFPAATFAPLPSILKIATEMTF